VYVLEGEANLLLNDKAAGSYGSNKQFPIYIVIAYRLFASMARKTLHNREAY
jgi:hypothetical protein